MAMHNSFSLDTETKQFKCLGGCLDVFDDIPPVIHVPYVTIVLMQNVNLWHYENDYVDETFWPNTSNTLCSTTSSRDQSLNKYHRCINPEWGRKAEVHVDDNTWGRTVIDEVESSNERESPKKMARYQ